MITMMLLGRMNRGRTHGWGLLAFWWGNLGTFDDVAAAGGHSLPVLIRLCSSVIHGHLALQRDDAVGTPRRRGGDRRVDVDVRRPSTNASRSRAGAVFWRSPPTDEGLDGTGDEGIGPTGPRGVFA